MILNLFFILIATTTSVYATELPDPTNAGRPVEKVWSKEMELVSAILTTALSGPSNKNQDLPKDQISIRCDFEGSSCLGAKVTLTEDSEKFAESQVISSVEGVVFSRLKGHSYRVSIEYPRYKVKNTSATLTRGKSATISLKRELTPPK